MEVYKDHPTGNGILRYEKKTPPDEVRKRKREASLRAEQRQSIKSV